MELKDRLVFYDKCANKKFDLKVGVLCSLIDRKPDFEDTCADFETSDLEKQKNNAKEYAKKLNNEAHNFNDDFSAKKDKDALQQERVDFLNDLKGSAASNQTSNHSSNSATPPWKVVLSVLIAIFALILLVMALS